MQSSTSRLEKASSKATIPTSSSFEERYATLQHKLDRLQKVHTEGKKSQESEVLNTKSALATAQKTNADLTAQLEKLKKHSDAHDARLQDLRRAALTDQTELKDLRAKLCLVEAERTQLATKHGEAGDAKRALHKLEAQRREDQVAAEARRKEDLRERDRRIAELEKSLSVEKKRRETAETRASELRGKSDGRTEQARSEAKSLDADLKAARTETARAQQELQATLTRVDDLSGQLDGLHAMLSRVTEAYATLSTSSVARATHTRLRNSHLALELRNHRLERKLANSEAQVVELAQLIRQAHHDKTFALQCLRDLEAERDYYASACRDAARVDAQAEDDTDNAVDATVDSLRLDKDIADAATSSYRSLAHYYFLLNRDLMTAYRGSLDDLTDEQAQTATRDKTLAKEVAARAELVREMQSVREELSAARHEHEEVQSQLRDARVDHSQLQDKLSATERERQKEATVHQQVLRREQESAQRLASAIKMHKAAEDALRSEISQLSEEMADLARYQEAYYALSDEVGSLAARNALAEDEAERLSQFNAEILSHNNPAQRIMYLDRIRRELADTKQELLEERRAKENALTHGDELTTELAMYKSVAVVGQGSTADYRPKTNMTRVMRVPLATQSLNGQSQRSRTVSGIKDAYIPEAHEDMTLDEIL
ncbi:hypothetical protein PENSPDRAFT_616693 [Peniophora sp. CONT]|nr:hypothetical protein PENSPDRAFT_616693 [Peniophora sp. CONT]